MRLPLAKITGVAAIAVLIGGALWAGMGWRQAHAVARLPVPPELPASLSAVRDHVQHAYGVAREAPSSIVAVGALCRAYHADMLFAQAEPCYRRASELAPDDWVWIYGRALIQSELGGGPELVASLRKVLDRTPAFAPAWLRLGEAEFKAAHYDEAAKAWQRASDLPAPAPDGGSPAHVTEVPLSAYASLGLARIALARDETERAQEILERLGRDVPQFGPPFRLLAETYRRQGREAEATRLIYRAGRLPPYAPYADPMIDELARETRSVTLLLRMASEASLAVNAEWSEYLTRRALEIDRDNPEVVVKLGRILRTVGRNDEALEFFMRYHQMVPGDYQGLAHIGSCLSALGRYEEAEGYFRKALDGGDDPTTRYNLGLLLALTGRLEQAIAEYDKALTLDPAQHDARLNLATALARQGRLDRAARELERLVTDDPDNAVAHTNLGLLLLQQGRRDRARMELTEALRLNPQLRPAAQALADLNN